MCCNYPVSQTLATRISPVSGTPGIAIPGVPDTGNSLFPVSQTQGNLFTTVKPTTYHCPGHWQFAFHRCSGHRTIGKKLILMQRSVMGRGPRPCGTLGRRRLTPHCMEATRRPSSHVALGPSKRAGPVFFRFRKHTLRSLLPSVRIKLHAKIYNFSHLLCNETSYSKDPHLKQFNCMSLMLIYREGCCCFQPGLRQAQHLPPKLQEQISKNREQGSILSIWAEIQVPYFNISFKIWAKITRFICPMEKYSCSIKNPPALKSSRGLKLL